MKLLHRLLPLFLLTPMKAIASGTILAPATVAIANSRSSDAGKVLLTDAQFLHVILFFLVGMLVFLIAILIHHIPDFKVRAQLRERYSKEKEQNDSSIRKSPASAD